jgi:hypothetical protein
MRNVILFYGPAMYKTEALKILMSTDKRKEISRNANYTISKDKYIFYTHNGQYFIFWSPFCII